MHVVMARVAVLCFGLMNADIDTYVDAYLSIYQTATKCGSTVLRGGQERRK